MHKETFNNMFNSGAQRKRSKTKIIPTEYGVYVGNKPGAPYVEKDPKSGHTQSILNYDDVINLYKNKYKAKSKYFWHAIVFSSDGFLEADDEDFFDQIVKFIKDGNKISYCFNFKNRKMKPDSGKSLGAWRAIRIRFEKKHPECINRIKGYFIEDDSAYEIGKLPFPCRIALYRKEYRNGRTVEAKIDSGYLYQRLALGDGDPESGMDIWLKTSNKLANKLHRELKEKCLFLDDGELTTNGNMAQLQEQYRVSFCERDGTLDKNYSETINQIVKHSTDDIYKIAAEEIAKSSKFVLQAAENSFDTLAVPVRHLDVGSGNHVQTLRFLEQLSIAVKEVASINTRNLQPTFVTDTLDSANFDIQNMKNNIHIRPSGKFETFFPRARYDIISFIHSTYMIDHNFLKKAISMLTPVGVLSIITSRLSGNFINWFTCELDKMLVEFQIITNDTPPIITGQTEDPFRNYAEDTLAYFNSLMDERGDCSTRPSFSVREIQTEVPKDLWFDSSNLMTNLAWGLCEVFVSPVMLKRLCEKIGTQEDVRALISKRMVECRSIGNNNSLKAQSVIITLFKSKFRENALQDCL